MTRNDEKQISYKGHDKLLELLEKIPNKTIRKEILLMFHNALIEHPTAQIVILDKNGTFLFHNYSIHGIPLKKLTGSSYLSTFRGKVGQRAIKYLEVGFKNALQGKRKDYEIELPNGEKYVATFIPVEKSGEVSYVLIANKEITHQKEVEKLKKTKQLYEEQLKDVVATRVRIPDGICEYISPSFKTVFGWELKVGTKDYYSYIERIHPDFREETLKKWEKALSGDTPSEMDYQVKTKKMGYRWFHQTNSGVYDGAGNLIAIECVVRDITERKALEARLNDFEERFNLILKEGKVAIGTTTYGKESKNIFTAGKVFFTESIKNITGYDAKDFFDDPERWIKIVHADDFSAMIDRYSRQLEEEDEVNLVFRCMRKDGFVSKVKVWGKIFRDDKGKPVRSECIFMDVSDKDVYDELLDYFARRIAEDEIKKRKSGEQSYIQ